MRKTAGRKVMLKALIGIFAGCLMVWTSASAQTGEAAGSQGLQQTTMPAIVEETTRRIRTDFGDGPNTQEDAVNFLHEHWEDLSLCLVPELFFQAADRAEPVKPAFDTYEKLLKCPLPADLRQGTTEKLAWYYYNQEDLPRAEELFMSLESENPGHVGAALGLGYIRLNTDRAAEALAPLEAAGAEDTAAVLELKRLVYIQLGWRQYDEGDFGGAIAFARRALAILPDDPDALVLNAWSTLKHGDSDQALSDFETLVEADPSPGNLTQLLDAQLFAGRHRDAGKTAEIMADSASPVLHQRAADFFFQHDAPIRAASLLDSDAEVCYRNADALRIELESYFRHRDGDTGTSRLDEIALSVKAKMPLKGGLLLSAGLTPMRIGSGSGPIPVRTGSYYESLMNESMQTDLLEEQTVVIPEVGLSSEGETRWRLRMGTTPLNGPVPATPTGELRLETDRWHIAAQRRSVTESVLSTIGMVDPYTGRQWGRVVRSGVSAGAVKVLEGPYWISIDAGADLVTGHDVRDNYRFDGNLSAGGTWLTADEFYFSGGLFLYSQHFERNSDFFTFGHGGYYSPDLMLVLGPFANYRSPVCRRWQVDLKASLGWLYEKTEDSPRYPLLKTKPSSLDAAMAEEADGIYPGKTDNGLAYSTSAEGWYFFTDHLALGGVLKGEQSPNYGEFLAAIGLKWFFRPQAGFWETPFSLTEVGGRWNR